MAAPAMEAAAEEVDTAGMKLVAPRAKMNKLLILFHV
jgi:hypothetical protein